MEHDTTKDPIAPALPAWLQDATLVVIDTETTGFSSNPEAAAVELAALKVRGGETIAALTTLIWTADQIPAEATKVHGITTDMARRGVNPAEAHRMLEWVCTGADAWVFHNAAFDLPFLRRIERWGTLGEPIDHFDGEECVICTLGLARRIYGTGGNKLTDVAARLGVEKPGAHRAMVDVLMTAAVLGPLAQKLPDVGSLQDLARVSEEAMRASERRFGRTVDFRASFGLPPREANGGPA